MGCWFVELRLDYDDLIFTVYLTSSYFGTPEETSSALSLGLTIAGFLIAILAPVTGQRNDKSGRGIFWLGVNTLLLVASMAACFFVAPTPQYLWLGVTLISAASVFSEFAYVNYNAVLPRISHPEISVRFGRRMGCRLHWRHPGAGCGAVGFCAYPRSTRPDHR